MKKILLITLVIVQIVLAQDRILMLKNNSIKDITKLILKEEQIAKSFEKYLLDNLSFPSIDDLVDNKYLGEDFSILNSLGESLNFKQNNSIFLKYHLDTDQTYMTKTYENEVKRFYTKLNSNDAVKIILKTNEAINILEILVNNNNMISKTCDSTTRGFCYISELNNSIRWYNSLGKWIEYDKKNYKKGVIKVEDKTLFTEAKISELPIGAEIFDSSNNRYIKMTDNKNAQDMVK